jgi:hypothetical protein
MVWTYLKMVWTYLKMVWTNKNMRWVRISERIFYTYRCVQLNTCQYNWTHASTTEHMPVQLNTCQYNWDTCQYNWDTCQYNWTHVSTTKHMPVQLNTCQYNWDTCQYNWDTHTRKLQCTVLINQWPATMIFHTCWSASPQLLSYLLHAIFFRCVLVYTTVNCHRCRAVLRYMQATAHTQHWCNDITEHIRVPFMTER